MAQAASIHPAKLFIRYRLREVRDGVLIPAADVLAHPQ
jgi:hypothetical protein